MSVIPSRTDGEGSPALSRWGFLAALGMTLAPALFAGSQAIATRAAIATSSPYATRVGLEVLRGGGTAADAAVAVGFALSVVQPEACGIGGGGALIYYEAKNNAVWTLDFRENAPGGLTGPVPRTGVAAIGVPSAVAGLNELHHRFGSRAWKELIAPAIRAAKGETATTLDRIATKGAKDFYDGQLASRIVAEVKNAGGVLSLRDLREYRAAWRSPIRITFGEYDINSLPPPSAGGTMIAEILNIVGGDPLRQPDGATIHLLSEAERRAAIDRDRYFSANETFRYRELMSEERAKQWRASIDMSHVTPTATLTEPAKNMAQSLHTSHFTIVDTHGNIASVTMSLGDVNGSGFVVPGCGFVLNDAAKSATASGDRIPSSMTPAIIFRNAKPLLALGSSGGAMTPAIVLQVFLGIARFGKSLADAVDAARYDQQAAPEDITYESRRAPAGVLERLIAMGHGLRAQDSIGDVHAILIEPGRLTAVSDPRSGGAAGGM